MEIGEAICLYSELEMLDTPPLQIYYTWTMDGVGTATGSALTATGKLAFITMTETADDLTWRVLSKCANFTTAADATTLRKKCNKTGIVFVAHPLITDYPWSIPAESNPKTARKTLDHQRKQLLRNEEIQKRLDLIIRRQNASGRYEWDIHMQNRTVRSIWQHRDCITAFQVWVIYRISTLQLNIHHATRATSSRYPLDAGCGDVKKDLAHIF